MKLIFPFPEAFVNILDDLLRGAGKTGSIVPELGCRYGQFKLSLVAPVVNHAYCARGRCAVNAVLSEFLFSGRAVLFCGPQGKRWYWAFEQVALQCEKLQSANPLFVGTDVGTNERFILAAMALAHRECPHMKSVGLTANSSVGLVLGAMGFEWSDLA